MGAQLKRMVFVVALASGLAERANAAELSWSAPAGCPVEEDVRARLERELGAELAALPDLAFAARVKSENGGFELLLETRQQGAHERRIRAATCGELVDALVVAVSLALHSSEAEPEPSAAAEPSDQPAPPEPEIEPSTKPSPAPPQREPPASSGPELIPLAALGGLLDVGTFPEPAFGAELLVGARVSSFKLLVLGGILPEQEMALSGGAGGRFELAFGGAGVCYVPASPSWELGGCLSVEIGSFGAVGTNVTSPRQSRSLWLAASAAAWGAVRPAASPFGLFVAPGISVPIVRQPFEITDLGVVHEPAAVGLRVAAGFELLLR